MSITNRKCIVIEGDKAMFASKGAVDRLKRDLREDNKEKLSKNDYLKEGWTYKIASNTDTEMKVQLVNIKDEEKQARVLESDERRKMLKEKIKMMRMQKLSPSQLKQNLKNKVPSDVLDAYLELRKVQLKVPIPPPDVVLSKPDEFKNIVHTMVQSFGMFKGNNNPVINYYRLLAKHLGLPTEFVPPNPQNVNQNNQTNEFIEMLRKQRDNKVEEDVDDEMRKIYESLGIETEKSETSKSSEEKTDTEEVDDEMKKIYESLGLQMKDSSLEL